MWLRMRYNELLGWYNSEIFSFMPTDRSLLYSVLQSWRSNYKCRYLLLILNSLPLIYYSKLYLCGCSGHERKLIYLAIPELAVMVTMHFLVHAEPDAMTE